MKIYLVGGAVRDKLLGREVTEKDWVVVGATVDTMLKRGFRQVGKEFPVFLHPETNEEYALARKERKIDRGYKGFTFDASAEVTLEEDLQRRDLTINAMAETATGELIDPYNGKQDLEKKILRHISPAFAEDPVRILRVARFYARYAHLGFHVAPETIELMRSMVTSGEVNALVAERVWKELERALGEAHPEKFFELLAACEALPALFPEIQLTGQGMQALINAAQLNTMTVIRFAALLHDFPEPKKSISAFTHRYRVPNAYRELALLTALHYERALKAQTLSAETLLKLFNALDIFRREERFQHFLTACAAITADFARQFLEDCAAAAKSYDVQTLIKQGYIGQALASQLQIKRREKIQEKIGFREPPPQVC